MQLKCDTSQMYWFYNPAAGLNFGDWVGPFIYEKRLGHPPSYIDSLNDSSSEVLFTCGSILHKISQPDCAIVWGSGAIKCDVKFSKPLEIISVRGPMSRSLCLSQGYDCPDIYGDPGLLLPEFYQPAGTRQRWRLGIVPHYVDLPDLLNLFGERHDVKIIDVRRPVTEVVDDIVSCDAIVSTSLHGVVVALSYRIPTLWARYSNRIIGGNFKFWDFYLGAGVPNPPEPFLLEENVSFETILHAVNSAPKLPKDFSCKKLMSCCPF